MGMNAEARPNAEVPATASRYAAGWAEIPEKVRFGKRRFSH